MTRASKKEKGRILDEFVNVTGYHRKALWHFTAALNTIQLQIKQYEGEMISAVEGGQVVLSQNTVDMYFAEAMVMVKNWGVPLDGLAITKLKWHFRRYWQGYNKLNGII